MWPAPVIGLEVAGQAEYALLPSAKQRLLPPRPFLVRKVVMKYPWTEETVRIINNITPDIKGKAFDPDWFLLLQRFEQIEDALRERDRIIATLRRNQTGIHGS
jgi:hypothetical protein